MRKPNFFIVGAPKYGTTSLAHWLSEHPAVFMTRIKELDFFNSDIRKTFAESMDEYLAHFDGATEKHEIVGEASTGYLRSHVAVPAIERAFPGSRYIVCLRNPVEMAWAWHRQMLYESWEVVQDFEAAWSLQAARCDGKWIPANCIEPANLQYAEVCALGSQVERLLEIVGAGRLHFVQLEHLRDHPADTYHGILSFLDIPEDGREYFPVLNATKRLPKALTRAIRTVTDFKRRHHIGVGLGFLNATARRLSRPEREPMPAAVRLMLCDHFRLEVQKLQYCIGRDLSYWR